MGGWKPEGRKPIKAIVWQIKIFKAGSKKK